MQLRKFGTSNGYEVTPASIGAMRFPQDCLESVELIQSGIERKGNLFKIDLNQMIQGNKEISSENKIRNNGI